MNAPSLLPVTRVAEPANLPFVSHPGAQRDLDQAFAAVRSFKPMDKATVAELLDRSRPYALEGKFELFKTRSLFDGTAKNAEWLGEDVKGVQELVPVME